MSNKSAMVDRVFEWYWEGNRPGADRTGLRGRCPPRNGAESIADLAVARTLTLDVDFDESVAAAQAAVGPVDVLVNNPGFGIDGPVEEVPLVEVRRAFETNFFGKAAAANDPGLRPRHPRTGLGHDRQRHLRLGNRRRPLGRVLLRDQVRPRGAVRVIAPTR